MNVNFISVKKYLI